MGMARREQGVQHKGRAVSPASEAMPSLGSHVRVTAPREDWEEEWRATGSRWWLGWSHWAVG
jgi:hypothetical protein